MLLEVSFISIPPPEFWKCEVATALKQIAPLKIPGLDGMPPFFYRHF